MKPLLCHRSSVNLGNHLKQSSFFLRPYEASIKFSLFSTIQPIGLVRRFVFSQFGMTFARFGWSKPVFEASQWLSLGGRSLFNLDFLFLIFVFHSVIHQKDSQDSVSGYILTEIYYSKRYRAKAAGKWYALIGSREVQHRLLISFLFQGHIGWSLCFC